MMRPFALEITEDDFGFAAGHRRHGPRQFDTASRQASLGPCATTSSPGGGRCSADPVRSNWARPSRQAWRRGCNACAGRKMAPGHRQASRPYGPHARGRSTGKPTPTPWRRMLRASWDGLAPHPWRSNRLKNIQGTRSSGHDRFPEGNQCSSVRFTTLALARTLAIVTAAPDGLALSLPAHRQEPGAASS